MTTLPRRRPLLVVSFMVGTALWASSPPLGAFLGLAPLGKRSPHVARLSALHPDGGATNDHLSHAEDDLEDAPEPNMTEVVALQGEAAYRALLSTLGAAESGRPELAKTPHRAAKAWRELTSGHAVKDPLSVARGAVFDVEHARDLVAVRDIPFHSLCEHHLLPFSGVAHVAYFPEGRVLGLSKFARLLHLFTRRLQLQERITHQFAQAVQDLLGPRAVAVSLEATHACMTMRGVAVPAMTRTIALRGAAKDDLVVREQLLMGIASQPRTRLWG